MGNANTGTTPIATASLVATHEPDPDAQPTAPDRNLLILKLDAVLAHTGDHAAASVEWHVALLNFPAREREDVTSVATSIFYCDVIITL